MVLIEFQCELTLRISAQHNLHKIQVNTKSCYQIIMVDGSGGLGVINKRFLSQLTEGRFGEGEDPAQIRSKFYFCDENRCK